jgi:hypothetical protein
VKQISRLFQRLAARVHERRRARREAWLATAVDVRDLERRLREYERAGPHGNFH